MSSVVSISCITYNHAKYIKACLDGFLMQKTSFPFEVIIHDDCSTDGTKEIIEAYAAEYPKVIFPYFQKENQYSKGVRGLMTRYNFPRCTGKYFALCEGDDYWTDPFKLQKQVDFLEANNDFSICFHNMEIINEVNGTLGILTNENQKSISDIIDLAAAGNYIYTASVLFKKSNANFPDWFVELPVGDYPMHLFNAQFGKIKFFDEVMGNYRIHEGGVWGGLSKEKLYERWIPMLSIIENKFSPEVNKLIEIQKKNALLDVYCISFDKKEEVKANQAVALLMQTDPFFLARKLIETENRLQKTLHCNAYKIGKFLIKLVTFPVRILKSNN